MEEEIKAEFKMGSTLHDEEEILKKCLTFCINYKLNPSDIVSSWDAYSFNRQLGLTVQNAHMDAFLQQLKNEQKEAVVKKESGLYMYSNDVEMILNDEPEDTKDGIPGTPIDKYDMSYLGTLDSARKTNGSIIPSAKLVDLVTPFGQRKNKIVIQSTLNDLPIADCIKKEQADENPVDDNHDIIKRVQPTKRCSLQTHCSQPEPNCRFMYNRIEDKFNFLENRIMKHTKAFVASGIYEEPMDPTVASQKSIFVVGMVCCDEEGRSREKPILLQSRQC